MNRADAARLVAEYRKVASAHRCRATSTLEMEQNRKVADAFHLRGARLSAALKALRRAGYDALTERLRQERAALDQLRVDRVMLGDDNLVVWTREKAALDARRLVAAALNDIPETP